MEAEDHQALPLLFSCRGVIGCSGDLELSTCGASAVPNGRCSLCAGLCARREFIRVFPLQLLSKSDPFPEIFPETQTPALGGGEALDLEARVAFVFLLLLVPLSPRAVSVALCHKPSGPMCVPHRLLECWGVQERTQRVPSQSVLSSL